MKHVRKFESFKNNKLDKINEEFILGAIKGALSKVMAAFGNTFKDFSNDFKKMFKEDDPNSIKGIIMTNFNQAVDGAQKTLGDKAVDEASVNGLMDMITTNLRKLADGLDKDIVAALGKDKVSGPKDVAKAILIGSKEAGWAGIVGLLDPSKAAESGIKTNYKYSKVAYETALTAAAKSSPNDTLKARKDAANKFLDNMQKDIQSQLDKEFTEEEVQKIYDDAKKKGGQTTEYKVGDNVVYKRDKFDQAKWDALTDDDKKKPNEGKMKDLQVDGIGIKKISKIEGDKISFEGADFTKTMDDILMKTEGTESEDAKKAAESLGKIKNDPDKMKKVATFSDFLQDEKNKDKVAEIEKLMAPEGGATAGA